MLAAFRGLFVPAVMAVLVATGPALAQGKGNSGGTKDNAGPRKYYLTKFIYLGSQAKEACEPGFHMASIWELVNIGTLRYDTTRGFDLSEDAGEGPPTNRRGWVRTGQVGSNVGGAGTANCNGWTDTGFTSQGSMAWLDSSWNLAPTLISPWRANTQYCNEPERVWCVQD